MLLTASLHKVNAYVDNLAQITKMKQMYDFVL